MARACPIQNQNPLGPSMDIFTAFNFSAVRPYRAKVSVTDAVTSFFAALSFCPDIRQ
jgi:hypothetical protein